MQFSAFEIFLYKFFFSTILNKLTEVSDHAYASFFYGLLWPSAAKEIKEESKEDRYAITSSTILLFSLITTISVILYS